MALFLISLEYNLDNFIFRLYFNFEKHATYFMQALIGVQFLLHRSQPYEETASRMVSLKGIQGSYLVKVLCIHFCWTSQDFSFLQMNLIHYHP